MDKYITHNSLFLVGSIQDVLKELRKLATEYKTVSEVIKHNIH